MIACWPGRIPAGLLSDSFGHTNDLLPTFCEAAGVPLPKNVQLDGLSLLPQLTRKAPPPDRGTVFWQLDLYEWYPQPGKKPEPYATEVARSGRWKLLARNGTPGELFDLAGDPGEERNLLSEHPKIGEELGTQLREWLNAPRSSCLTTSPEPSAK